MQNNDGFERLNASRLIAALGGDRELLLEIIELYLRDAPAMLHALRLEAKRMQPDELAKAAHVLKGSVANFGVSPLYELAKELEQCARAKDLSTVPEIMSGLERAYEGFEQALVRMRIEANS
ncbi:MAG TPA: Hpt domain-containing protein [Polyangiales bacterium]|jgi:two-component system sensor histidine kinase/response regulator|nr:Hpt domain-containing protein [Polyangiales bacterium]